MKTGIVTVYNSFNCGTFLQAYALQETLKKEGHTPFFVKNEYHKEELLPYRLVWCARYLLTGNVKKAKHIWSVYRNFKKAHKKYSVIKNAKSLDAVVYGSDTIWNYYQSQYLKSKWARFWGADFDGKKVSYAVSIGSADVNKLLGEEMLTEQVNKFEYLSVRDDNTYEFVKKALKHEKDITYVCDPTMLMETEDYDKLMLPVSEKGYVLFYYFGTISENVKKQVKEYAEKTGKKIIVFGTNFGFADKNISNDPLSMISYYKNADFVITNTFHGNIFSLIFNKPFISFGKEKEKVVSLLSQFDVSDRLVDTDSDFSELFEKKIDFDKINDKRASLKEASLKYLRNAIGDKNGDSL